MAVYSPVFSTSSTLPNSPDSSDSLIKNISLNQEVISKSYFDSLSQHLTNIILPAIHVLNDVSRVYGIRLYRYMLSNRNQSKYYAHLMKKATCYEQYAAAGYLLDQYLGLDKWKYLDNSPDFEHKLLQDRLTILQTIRKNGDIPGMIFNLRSSLSRNLADMGNIKLYEATNIGTKVLIEDYIDEVTKQLNFICDMDFKTTSMNEWDTIKKLEYFKNIQKSFGRTALLLSGGGSFGLAHFGVIKVLWEQNLLPRIITGSSAGAIIAAVVCCTSDKDMHEIYDLSKINYNFFEKPENVGHPLVKLRRLFELGVVMDPEAFHECMIDNIGDITFAEAYNRTRRVLNITVSSSTNFEMPKILNYLTAPNVLIRSAVAASAAVPVVFMSVPLMAKDSKKNIVPWNPSGHRWIDGSVEGDLPMKRISELFGVNHYCVVQLNPHVMPFMNSSSQPSNLLVRFVKTIASAFSLELQHRLLQMIELGFHNDVIVKGHAILCQKYVGDITIIPSFPWYYYPSVLATPNLSVANEYTLFGERGCWNKIALLRNHCLIEQNISKIITRLREQLISEELASPIDTSFCEISAIVKKKVPRISITPISSSITTEQQRYPGQPATPGIKKSLFKMGVNSSHDRFADIDSDSDTFDISDDDDETEQDVFPFPNSMKMRNHRSADNLRNMLDAFTPVHPNQNLTKQLNRVPSGGADPLYSLNLTFEESD
ncbi:acyl transferase/acyl hydrolase/lysophospholipase [Globomyces pollinis-pini]|nr:acyl transferase/acyl hydrolase/lysophospholipase [Globomyces pollinis-pini]